GPGDGPPLVCGAKELIRGGIASLEVRDCGDAPLDAAIAAMWVATAALARAATQRAGGAPHAADLRWAWAGISCFARLATSSARADHYAQRGPWRPPTLLDAPRRARELAVSQNESLWLRWAEAADAAVAASGREWRAAVVAGIAAERVDAGRE